MLVAVFAFTLPEVQRCGVWFFLLCSLWCWGAIGEVLVLLKQLNIVQIFLMSIYIICV